MFKFTPFNWASSVILSKFLKPYFKELDDKQVDVGFWDGQFTLRNLELRREVFLINDLNLEVVDSLISELKITIPWKSIKTEPIQIEIKGLKLIVSNKLDQTDEEKEEVKKKMHQIKMDALDQFEASYDKYNKEELKNQNNHVKKETKSSNPFYTNWIQNISQNFKLKIENIEIVYIYHVTKFEVLKIGLNLDKIEIGTVDQNYQQKNSFNSILKNLNLVNLSVFFEFYDSFVTTQIKTNNFFDLHGKSIGFFTKYKNANNKNTNQDPLQLIQQKQAQENENYIIKDLNVEVLIKLDLFYAFQLELNINIPDTTIFLKQNQMRLVLKSLNDLANYDPKRPVYRPNEKIPEDKVNISTVSPVKQWWQYAIERVIDQENLPLKTKQKGFLGFFDSFKYRKIYTKKKLQIKLKENEIRFFEQFELSYPLSQLIVLRQIAINTFVRYKTFLFSDIFQEKNESEKWFKNFGNIPISKIQSLNYHFIKDDNFEKTYKTENSSDPSSNTLNSSQTEETSANNEENKKKNFPIICEIHIGHFEILIEENSMLSDVKNLHQQANLFKESLSNTPHLQQQVLRHIKKNFIQELSRKGINQHSGQEEILEQSEDQAHLDFQWNHTNICKKKKILLCFQIENAVILFNKLDTFVTQTQVDIKTIKCLDMHSKNKEYDNVLLIDQGVQFMIKQEVVKVQKVALKNSTEERITHNNIDMNIPSISLTLCKPFIERCNILMQVIFFDPEKSQEKPQAKGDSKNEKKQGDYNFEKQQQFYTQFLQQKDKVNTFTNMAINISNINVNLPLNYEVPDKLLVIQLKSLKIFKREHESLLEENLRLRKDTHEEFKTEGDILEPLLLTVHCLKILIAQDNDWELNQNIFLHNLKQKTLKNEIYLNVLFQKRRVQKQTNTNEKNFNKKQVEEQTQIILETLPISVRMEKSHNSYQIGTYCLLPRDKKVDFKKNITPSTQKLFVNLPFFLVNISISQLQILLYLAQVWSLKGYNLLSALQDQGDNIQGEQTNQNGQINELDENKEDKINGEVGKSLFGRSKIQEKKMRQIINRNIQYDEKIMQYLQEHVFFQMDFQMEGLQLNLNVCSKETMKKYDGRVFHSNEIIQVNILNLQLHTQSYYFSNNMLVSIETFLIENRNCCQYDLLENLKHQCTHSLSKSDLQVVLRNTCPLNQDVSHFQSIIYKNRQTADKFYKKQLKKRQKKGQNNNNNKQGQNKKDILQDISVDDLQSFIQELERNQKGTDNGKAKNKINIDGVVIESDNESEQNDLDDNDNNEEDSIDFLLNNNNSHEKDMKKSKDSGEKEEVEKLIKNLMYFEEEYLLLNLKDQENATNQRLNGEQFISRCEECYGPDSRKRFLMLNFQNRQNAFDQTNNNQSDTNNVASPKQTPYQYNRISEQNIQNEDAESITDNSFMSVQKNYGENMQEQLAIRDITISIESIDDEQFVAKEDQYHDLIPSNIIIQLNHPVITLDPLILAYLKSIIEISTIYATQRVEDFKEYMQARGFSPYIEEEKEDQVKAYIDEQISSDNKNMDAINSKINSQLTLISESITIQMLHNVPLKDKQQKSLEPAFLLYLSEFILIQKATLAYNLLTINSQDVSLYDISEKTGLHTQTLGSFEKINNQQSQQYPCNQLSIEMKTFHSKELSEIQQFSSYIGKIFHEKLKLNQLKKGIKLEEAKIVFLKRNTMEIQVYIRQFLLAALRNRIKEEDLKFIKEYSKKLIYKKYDLFIEDQEPIKNFQEPIQNAQQQPEPSDMKMEIVVLNSIVCAYRSSLSEHDGLFLHFSKLGYWFTGKWGQEFLESGLIDTGKHYFEEQLTYQTNQNSFNQLKNSFQECKAKTQNSLESVSQNVTQDFESYSNTNTKSHNKYNNHNSNGQDEDQFFDIVSENQENDQNINQKITQNYTQPQQYQPSKNLFQFLKEEDEQPSPQKTMNSNLKYVKSHMHISQQSSNSSKFRYENIKQPEDNKVIEIQRIFMWDLRAYASEEFLNRDIVIMSPPDKPSVEVKIIFDDPNFTKYTGITDIEILPMKIAVNIPELSLFLYDKDYCTLCKLFQENIAEAPRTVFINQEFDIYNQNIWQFLDISVQRVNAKMFQGERINLQEQLLKDYNYQHNDTQVDNNLNDVEQKAQIFEMEKQDPQIYRKNKNFSYANQVIEIKQSHSRNNSSDVPKLSKNKNQSKSQVEQEKEDNYKEMPVNSQHDYFLQQVQESQQIKKGKSFRKYKNVFLISNPASLTEMTLENVIYHFYMHENGCKIMKVWATKLDISDFRMCSLLKNNQVLFDIKDWQHVEEANEQYTQEKTEEKNEGNNLDQQFINLNDSNEYGIPDDNSLNSDELNINEDFDLQHGKKFGKNLIANQDQQQDYEDDPHPEKKNQNANLDNAIQENDVQIIQSNRGSPKIILEEDSILDESQRQQMGASDLKLRHKQEKMMRKNQKRQRRDQQNGIVNGQNQIQEKIKFDTDVNIGENDQILEDKKRSNTNDKFVQIQVEDKNSNSNQKLTFWQKVSNFFCCRRKKQPQQQAQQKQTVKEKQKELPASQLHQMPTQTDLKRTIEVWPQDDFPKGRKWVINNYQQCLPITIPDTSSNRIYQYNDMEQQYNMFRMNNLYNFIGSESDQEYNDLKFAFITQPDGEKLIKIHIKNKNFLFMNDFLFDLIAFFRTPFNGSDDILNKQFFRQPKQNNYPPMVIKIQAENFWALILDSLHNPSNCLAVNLNADYLQEWIGDSGMGPGSALMDINIDLRKLLTCSTDKIYKDVGHHLRTYSISTIKIIQKYLNDLENQGSKEKSPIFIDDQNMQNVEQFNQISDLKQNDQAVSSQNGETPRKKLAFFNKKPANQQAPGLVKQESSDLQKEIQKVEFNTNLIIPFKIRFTNSYVIDYYKLKKQYEDEQVLQQENILQDLQKSQNNSSNTYEKSRQNQQNKDQTPYTHQEIQISIFNKRVKKFRNLNISMYSLKQISTITSTMMNPSTYITIFKEEANPMNNQLTETLFKVKCITDDQKPIFLKSGSNQDCLKQYVPKRLTNEEIQQFQKNPEEKCIGYLRVKLKRFKLEAFKNYFGNQTMKIKISNLILKKISKGDNSSMGLKGQIKIKYYNKRKGFYEPFLEPWIFHVQNQKVDSDSNLHVQNYEDKSKENHSKYKELESVLSHRNSLNINLSTAFIETAIEAKNAFGQTNQKLRPYNIVNKLGFGLLFLLGENKKILMEDLILQMVSNNEEKEYLPHTQNVEDKGRQIKKIKNLFVNFIILKPQKEKQILERIELYVNGLAAEMKRIKQNNQPLKSNFNNKSNYFSYAQNTNMTHSSTYVIQDSIQGLDRKLSSGDAMNLTQKEQKFKQKILISKNFSDFRTINRASLDRLGKQFFQLENLNAQHFNTNKQDRNKILEKYKDIKNLLHQTDKDFFVVDVSLDSGVGRKQITLQSSATIFNNLNQEVYVGFLKKKQSDKLIVEDDILILQNQKSNKSKENQSDVVREKRKYIQLEMYKIEPYSSFPIPYNYLSQKRDVFIQMQPDSQKINQNSNQNKSKTHIEFLRQILVTSDKNGQQDEELMDQIDEEIADSKVFNIEDFIQPYSTYSEYDQVDDLKLNEIVGKPCLEFENEKFGRLILRQNFELKQNKKSKQNGKNAGFDQIFQINVIKTKWPVQNISEKSQMYCYETSIVLNPFLKIVNQTIQDIQIVVGDQDKTLAPGDTLIPFNVDFVKAQQILIYQEPSNKIQFNPFTKKLKDFVKIEPSQQSDQIYPLCLNLEYTKISKQSRVVVIYCPYIVFNRTGLDLYYKEDQKVLQVKKSHFERKKNHLENRPAIPSESKVQFHLVQNESLQMFNPSNSFKKLSIGIFYKSPQYISWSQKISFTQKNHVGIQLTSDTNYLYEVNVNLSQGVGDLSKTEIITITPKYYFYNQTEHTIVVSQKVPIMQDSIFQLDQEDIQPFFWMQKDGQQIIYLSFFQDIKNPKFSNPFKIDEINTFAVKVPFKDESQQGISNPNGGDSKYKYKLITVSITQMNGVFCVRFLEKGQPPPYVIFNKTNHEIFVQQYIPEYVKTCCSKKRNQLTSEKKVIFPKQRIVFTWDHWNIDFDKQLSVEIDTNQKTYNLEKLKDYEPIYLQKVDDRGMQKESDPKKKILYKKGYLLVCDNFKDQFTKYFCILNIYKQKLKFYINKEKIQTIDLVYAKLEISREGFDILTAKQKRLNIKQSEDSIKNNLFDWYISIYNSIQLNMPDKVDFKIEPRNGTMEITFYQQKKYFETDKGNNSNNKRGFLDLDEDGVPYQIDHLNYHFNIKNMIGISIIDDMTQELFSVSLKNLSVVYQVAQKWIKEDDEVDVAYNQQNDVKNQDQMEFLQNVLSQKRQTIKHVTKSFFQFSLENIFINNQDISKSQYPVIFASDTKKTGEKPPPFIFISTQWKNVKNIYEEEQSLTQEQIQQINVEMEKSGIALNKLQDQQDNKNDNKKYVEMSSDEKMQKNAILNRNLTMQKYRTVSLDNENQDDIDNASAVQGDQSGQQVVQWINNLQIYFDHFEIRIDQQIIQTIIAFNTQLSQALYSDNETKSEKIDQVLQKLRQTTLDQILIDNIQSGVENMKKAIYIKNLSIQPINFCLTLNLAGADNALGSDIFSVPLAIFQEFGLELVAIDQASISLNALNQQHLYDTFSSIQSRIQKHYISQFLTEIYKIFGSFEAIGNPVKLVKNISSSVQKMIYNPLKSLQQGRGAQAVGDLATGAISLVQNSISSIYKAARNISGFIMRVISKITFHKQYLQDRSIRVNRQIKNIRDGFQIGCKNFLLILWDTVYGIIYIPLEGCKKKHIFGLIKGIYTAFVSIFIKPTVGIYDFLISIFDGLVNSAIYEEHIMEYRSRPPRIFETQQITNFEYKNAIGKDILLRVKQQPKSYESIKYYDQIQVSRNKFVEIVLTDIRLVCAQKNSSLDYKKVQLHKIKYIEYNQKKKYFKFYYDVPVKNILKCCSRNNIETKIRYEKFDNQEKANRMIKYLQEHYKQQKIPIKINIKSS